MIGIPFLLELVSLERVTSKDTTFTMHTMFPKEFFDVDIRWYGAAADIDLV